MKLDVDLNRLERARASINAPKAEIGSIRPPQPSLRNPIEIEIIKRGSIILSGKELLEVLHFPAGIAAIGDTQITLHIYQPWVSSEDLRETPAPNPKFHVADCLTLDKMRDSGRLNRYVSTTDQTGLFRVEPWDRETNTREEEINSRLAPCINCLKLMNFDGFTDKTRPEQRQVVNNFEIDNFLSNYEPIFRCLPLYTPENFPEGNYTSDWARISEDVRRKANWKCSTCPVDLSKHRRLLHVHHRDGNRGNNKPSNLQPLCCVCHQKQPFHGGMNIKDSDRLIIESLRSNLN